MMIAIFLAIGLGMVNALLSLLPLSGTIPTSVLDVFTYVISGMKAWSFIIPYASIITAVGIAFAWHTFYMVFKLVFWLLRKIPFLNIR